MIKQQDGQPASGINVPPDELFEWVENPVASLKSKGNSSLTSPLRPLKTIIWSVDWEISDEILQLLNDELNRLKRHYQADETVIRFLQLMEAVGKYITKRKGKSHPESVILLRELFSELELIVFMMGMPESERKARLQKQMGKFNSLKKKLAASRTPEISRPAEEPRKKMVPKKEPPAEKKVAAYTEKQLSPDTKEKVPTEFSPEVFRQMMLYEMRLVIRYEFKKFKSELEQMIKNQRSDKRE